MKYVAYYRVSTSKQGLGLDAQQNAVKGYITASDTIIAEFREKESGKIDSRPELISALEQCRRHDAVLLIAKLDRLSRNVRFLFTLKDAGIKFQACDCPELDTMTLSILAGFAQRERELISYRTRTALQAKKAKGEQIGNHKAKFTDDMRVAALKARQAAAANNEYNLRAWGCIKNCLHLPFSVLADTLNESKHYTAKGGQWRGNQVKRLIAMYSAC